MHRDQGQMSQIWMSSLDEICTNGKKYASVPHSLVVMRKNLFYKWPYKIVP